MCARPLSVSFRELGVRWFCYMVDLQSKLLPVPQPNSYFLLIHPHSWSLALKRLQRRPGNLKEKPFISKARAMGACNGFRWTLSIMTNSWIAMGKVKLGFRELQRSTEFSHQLDTLSFTLWNEYRFLYLKIPSKNLLVMRNPNSPKKVLQWK